MSCELIVDVDVPYSGDKMVLNAVQSPKGPWTIELTKTRYILDPRTTFEFPPVSGAVVTLFEEDGTSHILPESTPGYYWIDRYPEEGKKYRIVAKANGYNDIGAETSVPKAVKIIDIKWDSTSVQVIDPALPYYEQYYSRGNIPFTLALSDPMHEKNYYTVDVYYWYSHTYVDPQTQIEQTDTLKGRVSTYVTDPILAREEDHKNRFSDFAINGQTYSVSVNAIFNFNPESSVYRIEVALFSVSEDYFKYEDSRELFTQVEGDPFAQPVQIYTNVKDGLGIFAGFSSDQRTFSRKYPD